MAALGYGGRDRQRPARRCALAIPAHALSATATASTSSSCAGSARVAATTVRTSSGQNSRPGWSEASKARATTANGRGSRPMGCRRRCVTASCCARKVEALVALGKGESYRQSAWNARRSAGPPTAPGRTRGADRALPRRRHARAARQRPLRRHGGCRLPQQPRPRRLWKLAARPSNSQAHWDSVFAELDPRGDRPRTILVADSAWGAWNAAGARWPDIRRYRCAWHREERARKRLAKAGYRSNSEPLVRLLQRRTATGRVPCDIFTDPFAYLTFRLALREETARTGLADLVTLETHAQRGRRPHLARAARVAQAAHHRRRRGGRSTASVTSSGTAPACSATCRASTSCSSSSSSTCSASTTPTTTPASCARTTSPTGARRRPDAATTAQGSRSGSS